MYTYVTALGKQTSKIRKLYWMRGSGKWEAYEPQPDSIDLHELLTEIKNDAYGCFLVDSVKGRTKLLLEA